MQIFSDQLRALLNFHVIWITMETWLVERVSIKQREMTILAATYYL